MFTSWSTLRQQWTRVRAWALSGSATTLLVVRASLVFAALLALALIWLLVRAIDHRTMSEQNITYLLLINSFAAVALLSVIVVMGWRLLKRMRERQFGSRLLLKLATIFALLGFLPGLLIYSVSYQFVSRSIESWFDVRVETALEAGLSLARGTLEGLANDLGAKVQRAQLGLDLGGELGVASQLETLREQLGAEDAQVWTSAGALVASAGESRFSLTPDKPASQQLRALRGGSKFVYAFEGLDDVGAQTKARLRVLTSVTPSTVLSTSGTAIALKPDTRILVVIAKLPTQLVTNALHVQAAHGEYQERALTRTGLQKMYIGTLTLSLFLAVLGAFVLAVILGNQLAKPLLHLASGVQRVRSGDLTPIESATGDNNELSDLTRAFAEMTQELSVARALAQKTERLRAWNEVAQRVAHEIKNPLTPIQLSAERMAMKLGDKLQDTDRALLDKSVKTIVEQVDAMKRLVNEFRDYGRLPTAQLVPLNFMGALKETLTLFEAQCQSGVIRIANTSQGVQILGDAQQLRQVLLNLIQNALDAAQAHSPEPKLVIEVTQSATHLNVQITDNGAGFAPQILARAFEPYNTTKPKGTGLGLAMVQKIVQEHGATVTLQNFEQQRGAKVSLSFPLIDPATT